MSKNSKTFLGLSLKDLTVFTVGLFIFTVGLLYYHHTYSVNSDDVAQKVLIHQLSPHAHAVVSPPDNFIIKTPINFIIDSLVHRPTLNIFITAWAMNLIGFFLFFVVAKYFIVKYSSGYKYLAGFYAAFLLLCAGNITFLGSLASPQVRTIEIGILFSYLWFIDKYVLEVSFSFLRRKVMLFGLVALSLGLFLYSDPAFLIFLVIPLLINACIYVIYGKDYKQFVPLVAFLAAGVLSYILFHKIFSILGLHEYGVPAIFVSQEHLAKSITVGMQGVLALENASFFGLHVFKAASMLIVANFLLMIAITIVFPARLSRRKQFWYTFFALQPVYLIATYILSTNVINLVTARYLILLPFYGVLLIALALATYKGLARHVLSIALILMTAGSFSIISKDAINSRSHHPNSYNERIAALLVQNHLQKGYAPYWNANINTFYSNYKVDIFPITCTGQAIRPFYWVINNSILQSRAQRSFIVVANNLTASPGDEVEAGTQGEDCTTQEAVRIFGEPQKVIDATDYTKIYIYNHDLIESMPQRTDFKNP
jgi:hypothetical protein